MTKDLKGRSILITGANSGIGLATATVLAQRGARLWLACRSQASTSPVIDEMRQATGNQAIEFLPLDLADLDSVRACAKAFLDRDEPLHVLINNAGVAGQRGLTKQGFEIHFGVNHLGHFLLTNLLLDALKHNTPARIVNVASRAHVDASGIDYEAVRKSTASFTGLPEYGVSKLCNILHAKELARRLDGSGVTTYSLHPGVIASNVWRNVPWPFGNIAKWFMKSNEEGALTSIQCAGDSTLAKQSGRYYDEGKEREPSTVARSPQIAAQLWEKSEEWTS